MKRVTRQLLLLPTFYCQLGQQHEHLALATDHMPAASSLASHLVITMLQAGALRMMHLSDSPRAASIGDEGLLETISESASASSGDDELEPEDRHQVLCMLQQAQVLRRKSTAQVR
jgi:hypothetical protein